MQGEFTLCGDAFDIDSEKGYEQHAWEDAASGPVTCKNCATIIRACKGVRIKELEKGIQDSGKQGAV